MGLCFKQARIARKGHTMNIGIDVSKDHLDIAWQPALRPAMRVPNNTQGHKKLCALFANQQPQRIIMEATGGEGVDLSVDAVGGAITKKTSLDAIRPGGATVWIGLHENAITLDSYNITLPEKQVLGTYAASIEELQQALDLMAAGKVDALTWVKRFPLSEGVTAFRRMLAAKGDDIKAVICP